jgi:rhodanese-related sulfurtransferase
MSKSKASRRARPKSDNRLWLLGLLLVVVAAGAVVVWRGMSGSAAPRALAEVTVAEAAAKRDAGAFILDVREPDEWESFHVPGSTLIPLGELEARVNEVPRDQEIVVVCRSGNRSQSGRDILLDAGFAQVTSMAGGLTEWRNLGFPTVSGP